MYVSKVFFLTSLCCDHRLKATLFAKLFSAQTHASAFVDSDRLDCGCRKILIGEGFGESISAVYES